MYRNIVISLCVLDKNVLQVNRKDCPNSTKNNNKVDVFLMSLLLTWNNYVAGGTINSPNAECRSSHQEVFLRKGVMKISANLQGNTYAEVWFQ